MPSSIEFLKYSDQNGDHAIVRRGDGRQHRIFVTAALKSSAAFGRLVAEIGSNVNFVVTASQRNLIDYSPEGFAKWFPGQLGPINRNMKTLQQAAQDQLADTAIKRATFSKPAVPLDQGRAAEKRAMMRSFKPAEAAKLAMSNSAFAAAVLDAPAELSGLSPALIAPITDSYVRARLTEHFGNIHSLKPSANDLLASGPDLERARMYAEDTIKAWNATDNEVDDVKFLLENVIDFVAVTADTQRDGAYQLLTSSDAA